MGSERIQVVDEKHGRGAYKYVRGVEVACEKKRWAEVEKEAKIGAIGLSGENTGGNRECRRRWVSIPQKRTRYATGDSDVFLVVHSGVFGGACRVVSQGNVRWPAVELLFAPSAFVPALLPVTQHSGSNS